MRRGKDAKACASILRFLSNSRRSFSQTFTKFLNYVKGLFSCKDAVGDEDPFFKRKGPPPNPLSKRTTRVRWVRTAHRGAIGFVNHMPSPREHFHRLFYCPSIINTRTALMLKKKQRAHFCGRSFLQYEFVQQPQIPPLSTHLIQRAVGLPASPARTVRVRCPSLPASD